MMVYTLLRGVCRGVIGVLGLSAVPLTAATITVTPATFQSAIAAARGGDTLRLVGTFGTLGRLKIQNLDYTSNVIINASQATFANTLTISNVDNLTFAGGTFDITGAPAFTQAIAVYGGRNITLSATTVIGSAGGEGVTFSGTTGATVSDGTFKGLQVAVVLGSVTNGNATRNTVTGAVSDGIDIANSHGVGASYNSCSDGNPGPGVHPDCVQLWSVTGQPIQSQIVVRNNTATGPTQGFTAFADGGGSKQVQIVNNTVSTSYSQGIACYACIDSSITDNRLATLPGAMFQTNLNVIGGSGNKVFHNSIEPYDAPGDRPMLAVSRGLPPGANAEVPPDLARLVGPPPPVDTVAAVPEPSSWVLLVTGFAAAGAARRRAGRRIVAA